MPLTFKDPNGVEWRVLVEHNVDHECPLKRPATAADLLAALGQLSQGWRHVPDTHEVIPKGRHEWVLKSELDAAESELAATKEKLAEVERERDELAALRQAAVQRQGEAISELADVSAERHYLRAEVERMRAVEPACRRCSECEGQGHHFLPLAEWDEEAGEFFCPCKHCDVKAPTCAECEEAIWPPESGLCAYCSEARP